MYCSSAISELARKLGPARHLVIVASYCSEPFRARPRCDFAIENMSAPPAQFPASSKWGTAWKSAPPAPAPPKAVTKQAKSGPAPRGSASHAAVKVEQVKVEPGLPGTSSSAEGSKRNIYICRWHQPRPRPLPRPRRRRRQCQSPRRRRSRRHRQWQSRRARQSQNLLVDMLGGATPPRDTISQNVSGCK